MNQKRCFVVFTPTLFDSNQRQNVPGLYLLVWCENKAANCAAEQAAGPRPPRRGGLGSLSNNCGAVWLMCENNRNTVCILKARFFLFFFLHGTGFYSDRDTIIGSLYLKTEPRFHLAQLRGSNLPMIFNKRLCVVGVLLDIFVIWKLEIYGHENDVAQAYDSMFQTFQ